MTEDGSAAVLATLAADYSFEIVDTYGDGRFAFIRGDVDASRAARRRSRARHPRRFGHGDQLAGRDHDELLPKETSRTL